MTTETGLKVVGYIRVSTDDQARTGVSLIDQRARVEALALSLGHELVDIIADEGESSRTLERPGLRQVLSMLDCGRACGIVVSHLDRLTRHVGDMVHLVERYFLGTYAFHLFSASEHVETRTAAGRLQIYILAVVSQYQRELIVEKTAGTMRGKRSRSEARGPAAFGSTTDPTDPRRSKTDRPIALVADPDELAAIRIMQALRAEGLTLRAIASQLASLGIPTKRGGERWSASSVAEILRRNSLEGETEVPTGDLG